MQGRQTNFLIEGRNSQILVVNTDSSLKIILIIQDSLAVGQQIYTDGTVSQLTGVTAFKNLQEFYQYLASVRTTP
jgi:hypothetical protein